MGAAGAGLQFQTTAAAALLEQTPDGQTGFALRVHPIEGRTVLTFRDGQGNLTGRALGHPFHIRQVTLVHLTLRKQATQGAMQVRREGDQQHA